MNNATKRATSIGATAAFCLLAIAGGALAAVSAGDLLHSPFDPAARLGIEPEPVIKQAPLDLMKATMEGGGAESGDFPSEAEFHVINGEYASTHFHGRHYTAVLYSQYREGNGNRWCHYEWGSSQSRFWRCGGNAPPGSN